MIGKLIGRGTTDRLPLLYHRQPQTNRNERILFGRLELWIACGAVDKEL